jgi:hypothetical protein
VAAATSDDTAPFGRRAEVPIDLAPWAAPPAVRSDLGTFEARRRSGPRRGDPRVGFQHRLVRRSHSGCRSTWRTNVSVAKLASPSLPVRLRTSRGTRESKPVPDLRGPADHAHLGQGLAQGKARRPPKPLPTVLKPGPKQALTPESHRNAMFHGAPFGASAGNCRSASAATGIDPDADSDSDPERERCGPTNVLEGRQVARGQNSCRRPRFRYRFRRRRRLSHCRTL